MTEHEDSAYIKEELAKRKEARETMRPSERRFRRSRAADQRRRVAERKESDFIRLVFGVATVATLFVFGIIYFMFNGGLNNL